jgi:hypothetical protein
MRWWKEKGTTKGREKPIGKKRWYGRLRIVRTRSNADYVND